LAFERELGILGPTEMDFEVEDDFLLQIAVPASSEFRSYVWKRRGGVFVAHRSFLVAVFSYDTLGRTLERRRGLGRGNGRLEQ
jgi:hypothetical protein